MSEHVFREMVAAMAADAGFAAKVRHDPTALAAFDLTDGERQRLTALAPETDESKAQELRERLSKSALFMPMGAEGHADAGAAEHSSLAGHMSVHQAADSGLDAFVESQAGLGDEDAS